MPIGVGAAREAAEVRWIFRSQRVVRLTPPLQSYPVRPCVDVDRCFAWSNLRDDDTVTLEMSDNNVTPCGVSAAGKEWILSGDDYPFVCFGCLNDISFTRTANDQRTRTKLVNERLSNVTFSSSVKSLVLVCLLSCLEI